ncbi:MAG: oxidoreductase [Acidobacteriota bacterium]|nr:oxidoreductase [Acidobacteriota bacterium]
MKDSETLRPVRLIILNPGHFHATLVLKTSYPQVSPEVHVFAPDGPEAVDHVQRVEGFNRRKQDPTRWRQEVCKGPDYLERMLRRRPGNVVVVAGNNRRKTQYINESVQSGLNVLSDKPMCVSHEAWKVLEMAFSTAEEKGLLIYDIMTERFEITTILQRELAQCPHVIGAPVGGDSRDPGIVKDSVHHLFKEVAGQTLIRPEWYFDVEQQGEGIVDVSTHLVDLVFWQGFPGEAVDRSRIQVLAARHWPTVLSREQYGQITGKKDFAPFLRKNLDRDGRLAYFCNGEILLRVDDLHARISVAWDFEAPRGGGDTHFSVIRGTRAHLCILQGKEQGYRPELTIRPAPGADAGLLERGLRRFIEEISDRYPGLALEPWESGWQVSIPDRYRDGHEAHFGEVTSKYLGFLESGSMPQWEITNMISKYYVTTRALEMARADSS